MSMSLPSITGILFSLALTVLSQPNGPPQSTFPTVYPGQPSGDLSPEWQNYFLVDESTLPNVTFTLTRSFAGNIPVNRAGHPNDTLFFWAFEKANGSLTSTSSTDPWLIWLQGGPGSSSMAGLVLENGPVRMQDDLSLKPNNFSWSNLVDSFWIDQPVGTGFSTSDATGYVANSEQMSEDFLGFLGNLVKVFPSLATRPLFLAGESYAGRWVPYIAKALLSTDTPPVTLRKFSVGDGVIPSSSVYEDSCVVPVLETYPEAVSYDPEVFNYFQAQTHLCGYDLNLTYPQNGLFPTLQQPSATDPNSPFFFTGPPKKRSYMSSRARTKLHAVEKLAKRGAELHKRGEHPLKRDAKLQARHATWKRDLTGRSNGTIDSWYACFLLDELYDYMTNFTFPYSVDNGLTLDAYDFSDGIFPKPATNPSANLDPSFFNDNSTKTALHAPLDVTWMESVDYPFNNSFTAPDDSPDPITFFSQLASNASAKGVDIILYYGNDDSLVSHHGGQISIQNTTFGGIQGFTRVPSTPWFDDNGNFAGIVHQERNITYVLIKGASHLVPQKQPAAAFVLLREFILGSNTTGLVENPSSSSVSVVGGEVATLGGNIYPGGVVTYGNPSSPTTLTFPSATIAAWNSDIQKVAPTSSSSSSQPKKSAALKAILIDSTSVISSFSAFLVFFVLSVI